MTTKIRAAGAAALAVLALGALIAPPAGATPSGTGSVEWVLNSPIVQSELPDSPGIALGSEAGTFTQNSWTWSDRTGCRAVYTYGWFGQKTFSHYAASGHSSVWWEDLHWTGASSSLVIDGSNTERIPFAVTSYYLSTCETLAQAAFDDARSRALARAETLVTIYGPSVGSVSGPDGRTWKTSGDGYFDERRGALSYSGDARLCDASDACVAMPEAIIEADGVRAS